MSQVDSRVAGKPYSDVAGRKEDDGSEAVIKLETLRIRTDDLIALYIAAGQASAKYNEAIKAVAKECGLLSSTVTKYIRARAGNTFLESKRRAQQLSLCFEELPEIDTDDGDHAPRGQTPAPATAEAPAPQLPLDNEPTQNPVEAAAQKRDGGGRSRRGNGVTAPE